jgi:hypothetical protein
MKESGRFESALPAADDDYTAIGELGQILCFGGVWCECARYLFKRSGPGSESGDAAGDDDAGSKEVASILKPDLELSSMRLDARYSATINVGYSGALIP